MSPTFSSLDLAATSALCVCVCVCVCTHRSRSCRQEGSLIPSPFPPSVSDSLQYAKYFAYCKRSKLDVVNEAKKRASTLSGG